MAIDFKKLLATSAATAALLLNSTVVFAGSESEASVGDDGASFTYAEDNDSFIVKNHNHGHLYNLDLGIGVSGGNSQSGNDDENSLGTGEADGEGESENFLNSNATLIGDDDEDGSAHASSEVGEDGFASATSFDNDFVKVENKNYGDVDNFTLGLAISGLNSQLGNDDGNELTTGESEAGAHALNEVNSNWTWIEGGHSANSLATVGDDGAAISYAEDNDSVIVKNKNKADLDNVSLAVAVSGLNSQSGNDDDNSLDSGGSSAESSANNFVNNNITVVGGSDGGSSSASSEVGEDGFSSATSFDNDYAGVENSNKADVDNASVAVGVSGGNSQSGNDDGNSMTTGGSSGSSCSSNTVNSNWTNIGSEPPEGGEGGC